MSERGSTFPVLLKTKKKKMTVMKLLYGELHVQCWGLKVQSVTRERAFTDNNGGCVMRASEFLPLLLVAGEANCWRGERGHRTVSA